MNNYSLLIGMGNMSMQKKYIGTRHNVGSDFIDYYCKHIGIQDAYEDVEYCDEHRRWCYEKRKQIILILNCSINKTGDYTNSLLMIYRNVVRDITFIHDDIELEYGHYKQVGCEASHKGHNGVRNIAEHNLDIPYNRVKIGIGKAHPVRDYVMSEHTVNQYKELHNTFFTLSTLLDV